jgi:hypothetical protein
MDCSGFVYWSLIQMGYTRTLVELQNFLKKQGFIKINRFFCKDFSLIYKYQKEFKYLNFIKEPKQGCILVIVLSNGNGHCMFVDEIIENNKDSFCLRIIDSTRYPHKNDTRINQNTGIGVGDIEIFYKDGNWFYNSNNPTLPIRKAQIYFISVIK